MEGISRYFDFEGKKTSLKVEVIAGITTFLSMAYIIIVNPDILKNTGMDHRALVIATCLAAGLGTIFTGLLVKAPIAMAPGMGLNAFFTYTLVLSRQITWQTGLGIVFISGLVFFILSVTGVREKVVEAIPLSVLNATSVGIGLFITFIGLKNLELVIGCGPTLVTLGKFTTPVLIGLAGLLLIIALEALKVRGSILIGITFSTFLGFAFGQVPMPKAALEWNFNLAPLFAKLNIFDALKWGFIGPIFSLMFIDMFDSVGTIVACAREAGMVDDKGKVQKVGPLLTADAVATMAGAVIGTSTTTSYVESGTGIEAGGRTGMTAVVTGLLFILAIIFTPIITLVPSFATAPALIIVGLFMIRQVKNIDFVNLEIGFPAFITIVMMPLTYSISTGLAFGFISHTLIKVVRGKIGEIGLIMWIITILSVISLVTSS